ncbi:MAG: Ig-like domain-containing protein, partial [Candidatus Desantisbacteria bacterium]
RAAFSRGTWTAIAANIGTATMGTWSCILSGSQLGLTDGTYTVTLSAADIAGNLATPATVSIWTYDTQIGSITLSIPSGSYTNQASIAVAIGTLTPQEQGTISYLLGEAYSSMPSEVSGSWTTTKPAAYTLSAGDGVKTLYLWVKDLAGNITQVPATASIILDTTQPNITLNKPCANGFGNGTITLSYTLNENVKPESLLLTFVGAFTTATSSSWSGTIGTHELVLNTFNVLSTHEGSYTVYLSAEDMAGNTNTSTSSNNWTYDITLPKGTLSIPASNGINNQNILVFYTLSEQASSVMLKFTQVSGTPDGASPHGVTARLTANNGDNGTITLNGSDLNADQTASTDENLKSDAVNEDYIEIVDKAGNIGSSAANTNWTYDSQSPEIKLTKPVTNGFDNNTIAVEYELSEQVSPSTIKLIFEGPSTTTTIPSGSLTVTKGKNSLILYGTAANLQEGTYSVKMEAVDLAGNKGESNISTGWVYDNTLGTPTIKLADGATYTKTALVDIAITDDAEAVTWYDSETQKDTPIENSPYWNSEPSYFVLNSKDDGTKTVYVWVKDRAENIRGGTDTIILDTIPPIVTLNKPEQNGMDNGEIAVDYTVSESQGIASVTLTFTWTGGASDGNHVLDVTSTTTTTLKGNGFPGKTGTESLISGAIYTVSLQAIDLAGNISIADANINWKYDPNPPQITLNKPAKDGVDNKSVTVNYTLSEAVDPASIRLIFTSGTTTIHTVTSRFFTGNIDDNVITLDGTALSIEGSTATVSLTHGATYTVK